MKSAHITMGSPWQGLSKGGDGVTDTSQVAMEICVSAIVQKGVVSLPITPPGREERGDCK